MNIRKSDLPREMLAEIERSAKRQEQTRKQEQLRAARAEVLEHFDPETVREIARASLDSILGLFRQTIATEPGDHFITDQKWDQLRDGLARNLRLEYDTEHDEAMTSIAVCELLAKHGILPECIRADAAA